MTVQNIIKININMRCIEILEQNFITLYNYVININMRCIEILHVLYILPTITININMRCIEIKVAMV